jgi:alpha-N-arabinofuranosidase
MNDPQTASIVCHRRFERASIDPRIFGGFAEHLGRCVYGGIYEPGHPTATPEGFRADVVEMVKELDMPVMRYPGGNFVSGYRWEDGIGPKDRRPRRLDPAWKTIESNLFGIDEFIDWCRLVETEPMVAVNLGTRGAEEARDLLEYCNHPSGTALSDLRRQNGHEDPHGVQLWCLGNEMDGPWQMGHKTAYEYGRVAAETARLLSMIDPEVELVACGSSGRSMPTFGSWETTVLGECYEQVDYLSLHTYYGNADDDTPLFLSRSDDMSRFIRETVALADGVAATKRAKNRVDLSFDEWNVWFHSHDADAGREPWTEAPPLLEDRYTAEDAVLVGSMLMTLLSHADRVKIACIAQTVNVIAPIMTRSGGTAWRQTIFHPFALTSRIARDAVVIEHRADCERYDAGEKTDIPYLSSVVLKRPSGDPVVFAVNRSLDAPMQLTIEVADADRIDVTRHTSVGHDDPKAVNTEANPDTVVPREISGAAPEGNRATVELPPCSWNVVELSASQSA